MQKVAVLGAGIMGAGIAQVAAMGGKTVILRDLQKSLVNEGLNTIKNNIDNLIKKGRLTKDDKDCILDRIKITTDLADLAEVDLLIEAVVENIAVKKQLFAELDSICCEETILASNTSSLSITEIASATKRKTKILGMHFFNPVPVMKLVELIKGIETSEETINKVSSFLGSINKDYVIVHRDNPGFIVNRILVPYINEAISIYAEGLASAEEIDQAMILGAGMPQGPLELADMIGLDILYSVNLVFFNEFRDSKYRPHPILNTMVRAGYYGIKTGKGFYTY